MTPLQGHHMATIITNHQRGTMTHHFRMALGNLGYGYVRIFVFLRVFVGRLYLYVFLSAFVYVYVRVSCVRACVLHVCVCVLNNVV